MPSLAFHPMPSPHPWTSWGLRAGDSFDRMSLVEGMVLSGGPVMCPRCGGLLVLEFADDGWFDGWCQLWRCVNCSHRTDPIMERNRQRNQAIAQLVADAEAHLQLCSRSVADVPR